MFLPASWLISFKLRAQGIANLVLLPSRPDTVRKDALALRPNGKKIIHYFSVTDQPFEPHFLPGAVFSSPSFAAYGSPERTP